MRFNKSLCLGLIALSPISSIYAEDATPKLWKGEFGLSYLNLSGNTEETTTSGEFEVTRKRDAWKYVGHLDGLSSKKDDDRTAEKYYTFHRIEYNFTEKNYIFGRVSYEDDKFNGFEYQATATGGLGRNMLKNEEMDWDIEAGLGYRVSEVVDNSTSEDEKEGIIRLSSLFKWKFSDTAEFSQLVSSEAGSDNTISNSVTALKVKVINQLSLKLSYKIKYTEEVPVATEHADTETLVSITFNF